MNQNHYVEIERLRIGMFVHLDLGWMDHPFPISNFKVKDDAQLNTIRRLGLKMLRYDPLRSDCEPLDTAAVVDAKKIAEQQQVSVEIDSEQAAQDAEKEKEALRKQRLRQLHSALEQGERKFIETGDHLRQAAKNIISHPQQALAQASAVVDTFVESILNQSEIAIHAINGMQSSDKHFIHQLNVTVLTMLMTRNSNISEDEAKLLGLAAIFHDVGKAEVPDKILLKTEPLTKSEQSLYEQHSEFGARIALKAGMPERAAKIILQHHELVDGTGYPKKLKLDQIDPLTRILSLISAYDELCNPVNIMQAKTPYEALAYLFASQRHKYDEVLLKRMIKHLGIYPPGSIVQLSNGVHGIVLAVNPNQPLRPFLMLHDPRVSREKPEMMDLRENPSLSISACLRPNQLPQDALQYFNPRKRISYFVGEDLQQAA